ncbi:MAG TPA: PAS domain-containing sensor histidine kinase [Mucilaginibacter sp.]|jgi:two-component system CheB/CheR fusion protein|nr:PAS domain-containing sensor histidine kinase [Mucilaginibacter sp.]
MSEQSSKRKNITSAKMKEAESFAVEVQDLIWTNNEFGGNDNRFRFLADAIPHKVWTSGPDGKATYYNQGWYDYVGITTFAELRNNIWNVLHPDDLAIALVEYPDALQTGREKELEQRFRRHDGMYRWHLTRFSPHRNERGEIVVWVGTSTDIHEQKLARQALQASEAHFKALTFYNSLPIWQMNAAGELVFVNDAWRAWSGVEMGQPMSDNPIGRIHPDDQERVTSEFQSLFAQRLPMQLKLRYKNAAKDEFRWILDNAHPVFNPDFEGYIGTMTDIHEQEQARLTVQHLLKKKDDFLAIASHELKTPITSMKASLQVLDKIISGKYNAEKSSSFIAMANKQVDKLMAIVTDLLDVSKIQSGKMLLSNVSYVFNESLRECVAETMLHEPSHQILIDETEPVTITADKLRIEQVIVNLLSNAIKYSQPGSPVIVKIEKNDTEIKCSVSDLGIGIPADQQPFIFDRFYRVDNSSASFPGLGLGLYISSEIVKKHKGKIGLLSEPGKGSTFWFTLPLNINRS